jgi:hypothetical protein
VFRLNRNKQKFFVLGFTKQTETQPKQIFGLFRFEPKFFFDCFEDTLSLQKSHRALLTGTPGLRVFCRVGDTRCSRARPSPPSCSHRPIDNVVFIKKGKYTQRRTNTKNSKQIFPEKELRGHSPNFRIHVSVSDLYIPMIHLPILLQEIWGPILGIYKSLTDT